MFREEIYQRNSVSGVLQSRDSPVNSYMVIFIHPGYFPIEEFSFYICTFLSVANLDPLELVPQVLMSPSVSRSCMSFEILGSSCPAT